MKGNDVMKYMAEDGKIFDSIAECEEYEKALGAVEYEITYKVNAILRLDNIILTRKIKTNAEPSFDFESEFRDLAFDAIEDCDMRETAGELLGIAARQNIYPYTDYFDTQSMTDYKKIE